jgi:dethiobiotin synthetase
MTDTQTAVRRLGVTGTDTGIGKTVVTCALAARARQLGVRVSAMKPVESGIEERPVSETGLSSDADRLRAACGNVDDPMLVRPYVLSEPLAPMVAAQRAGVHFDITLLDSAREQLEQERELLLVEGAGGLMVPLTPALSYAQLFARWSCELLVVAGNRLGVLNHVLLTVQAAEAAGLPVRAIVLTSLSDRDAGVAEATNFDALRQLLPEYALLRFPWVDRVDDHDALAIAAAASGLDALLVPA